MENSHPISSARFSSRVGGSRRSGRELISTAVDGVRFSEGLEQMDAHDRRADGKQPGTQPAGIVRIDRILDRSERAEQWDGAVLVEVVPARVHADARQVGEEHAGVERRSHGARLMHSAPPAKAMSASPNSSACMAETTSPV